MIRRERRIVAFALIACLLIAGCQANSGSQTETTNDLQTETQTETIEAGNVPEQKNSYPVFDFENMTVTLNSGCKMPILGLGTYHLSDSEAESSVYWALKAGFRLIDTARIYGNEEAVG